MPSYQYECQECNVQYTHFRSIKEEDPGYACDTCSSPLVRWYGISGTRTQKRLPEGDDFISSQMDFYGTDNWKEHYATWDVKPDRQ
jgi:putative FmdB family regulatory protein